MQKKIKADSRFTLQGLHVAILTAGPSSGEQGGAERFYSGLYEGFKSLGCKPDLVAVPADEPDFKTILSNYDYCQNLELSAYDIVVSTKAPTYAVNHPRHVMYLVHTVRVFDDMFEKTFQAPHYDQYKQRATLHRIDFEAMVGAKARFAIGHEVARRLYRWRGLECEVLHPPLAFNEFRMGESGDYFFLPGRLHHWKRVDLVIQAIKSSKLPMKLVIAGKGDAELELKKLAEKDDRIEFLGMVDDDQLVQLYADCLAVAFTPIQEDYGYVTLEAFASGKPVLTCLDAGEPSHIVRHHETGLVVEPTVESVRRGLEWLWENRDQASLMGRLAQRVVGDMSWTDTAYKLGMSALTTESGIKQAKSKIAVLDMQPIDPPVGGGRLRLLGLYHNLGKQAECTYVGSYDWPGESYRSHMLSETLREINVPLSHDHHDAVSAIAREAGGKVLIDLTFSQQAQMSPEYVKTARNAAIDADTVIFSHPWVYPLVKDHLRSDQVLIYDSQNVEGFLRAQLLDEANSVEMEVLRNVVENESDLGWAANWILACSHEDLLRFNRVYGFPLEKMRVVPNGVMAFRDPVTSAEDKVSARKALNIFDGAYVAIFIGSPYAPNVEAATFITEQIAPLMPQVTFVISGGVSEGMKSRLTNVIITGRLEEDIKKLWFKAADIGVNPMMSGSGTNIKMFDYMAMSLPVVTTSIGARGIETGSRRAFLVAEPTAQAFAAAIEQLLNVSLRNAMGHEARLCVEDGYAWERISEQLGVFIESRRRLAGQPSPLFSVVVPTYERYDQLGELIRCLQKQVERDFEVILIDQSRERWSGASLNYGFPLTYFHSPVKGAVRARNTGALLAQGAVIAFIDDDCEPMEDWLIKARPYFDDSEVLGIEGLIYSNHLNDPNWRPVTNEGFEGIGFMTANLFVRSSVFQYVGGFDLQFDRPHFREDTDFGWRMLELGKVPYAYDVKVFHPAQLRIIKRESTGERVKFFQQDALLFRKHPERYRELFFSERHFELTSGFGENLLLGFKRHGIEPPEWMLDVIKK